MRVSVRGADPRVRSGESVLRGTGMPVNAIVDNFYYGVSVEEIARQFEIGREQVELALAYAVGHRLARGVC